MTLLIDVGNTRIKWNLRERLDESEQQAAMYAGWTVDDVRSHLLTPLPQQKEVFIANVGGPAIAQLLRDAIQTSWQITPQFVLARASAAGVTNAYKTPEKLGIDRWLNVIAACHVAKSAACIVSVGTATTIDGVDETCRHLGGLIAPGPDLMRKSLLQGTSEIAPRALGGEVDGGIFSDNTLGAITQGAMHATAALIERALREMETQRLAPKLILTGGAAARICDSLRVPFILVPDLVLRGLAIVSQDPPPR